LKKVPQKIFAENARDVELEVAALYIFLNRGADKSLVGPGRKRATPTEDSEFHISYL
jgi:hypothetical protein